MAATGFTPVFIYASGTTGNIPSASNLTNTTNGSEIALNYFDGKLFYKNASNSVVTVPLLQSSGSQNGWLSSTDWTTFNNKQPAGTYVTSVTGTSPVASSGGTTPAISLASGYGDTQNPYASKTANYFLASPNGSAGAPTFRAIVAADIPTLNQNTTGTAAGLSATLAITSGGTGSTAMPSFRASCASQTFTTGVETKVTFNSATGTSKWNIGSYFDGTNNKFLPLIEGYYFIKAQIFWGSSTSGRDEIAIFKNGSVYDYTLEPGSNITGGQTHQVSATVYCNGSTDYIEIYAVQNSGGNVDINTDLTLSNFEGHWVRAA